MATGKVKYDFVIITPGRSGSDHFSETLSNFDDIHVDGEIFNRTNHTSVSFNAFLKRNRSRGVLSFLFNREKISSFRWNILLNHLIDVFLKNNTKPGKTRGFKLTLDQLIAYPFVMRWIINQEVKVIYLTRKDKLATVLSLIKARKSSVYNSTERPEIKPVSINPNHAKKLLKAILEAEANLLKDLKTKQLNFTLLFYEDLFDHYQHETDKARKFLGISQKKIERYSALQKVNPERLKEWVLNLPEVEAELKPILDNFPTS